ncbi:MAG: hypothetical protein H7836_06215 [Magnetococcus sp. YQC-3]
MKHGFFFFILLLASLLLQPLPGLTANALGALYLDLARRLPDSSPSRSAAAGKKEQVAQPVVPSSLPGLKVEKRFDKSRVTPSPGPLVVLPSATKAEDLPPPGAEQAPPPKAVAEPPPAPSTEPPPAVGAEPALPSPVALPEEPSAEGSGKGPLLILAALALLLALWGGYKWRKRRPSKKNVQQDVACELSCLPTSLVPLVGRRPLFRRLDQYLADPDVAIVACVAGAGVGKSVLLEGWLDHLRPHFGGVSRVFAWSFQHTSIARPLSMGGGPGSSGLFFSQALRFFGHEGELPESEEKRAIRLSELLRARPFLLILDGVDPLQFSEERPAARLAETFSDPGLYHLLRLMCHSSAEQDYADSLVLLTSRRSVAGPAKGSTPGATWQPYREIVVENLTEREGVELLKSMGVAKQYAHRLPGMVRRMHGHALTLVLLGGLLAQKRPEWQATPDFLTHLLAPDSEGEHLQRLLRHYTAAIWPQETLHALFLRLFGVFDRPMREEEWQMARAQVDFAQPLREMDFVTCANLVQDLEEAGFVLPYSTYCGWQLHALVRDYLTEEMEAEASHSPFWAERLRQAHGVLFDYFQTLLDDPQPDSLVALEPLYRAVRHGCRAGRYKEALHGVYVQRIRRGTDCFSLARWGAYSSDLTALAGFFPNGWDAPPVEADLSVGDRSWLLAEAAFCLTVTGRVEEALGPQEEGVRLEATQGTPQGVVRAAAALCDLQMATGRLRVALETAIRGREWAEQHALSVLQWLLQIKQATVLHRLGEWSASLALYEEVEAVPIEITAEFFPYMGMAEKGHTELLLEQRTVALEALLQRAEEAQQQAESSGHPLWITWSLLSKCRVLVAMGQYERVMMPLQTAIMSTVEREGETPLLAEILLLRATVLHRRGEGYAAHQDLTRLLEIARRWQLPLLEVDGRLLEGEILLGEKSYEEADESLSRLEALVARTGYGQRREAVQSLRGRWSGVSGA